MRVRNQYSDYIDNYKIENGIDPYVKYKDPNTTEEEKKELEEWLFNLIWTLGEVPQQEWNDQTIYNSILQLSNTDAYSVYREDTESFGYSAVGVDVLNHFFPELLDVHKPTAKRSIRESFHNEHDLRRIVKKNLSYDNSERGLFRWSLMIGSGYCTNFRPATAKAIYEIWGKREGCRVFDSSAGYGARLTGAHFAGNVIEYLGIDPNTKEHCDDVIRYLDEHFGTGTKKQVLKMGSEDFTIKDFPQYKGYFDLYFTSPPYFNTEQYSDDESQSYKKFPTYKGWIDGFYRQTIYNACDVLKKDGVFGINIFEKIPKIKEITKMFLADKGWYVYQNCKYLMHSIPGKAEDEDGNPISKNTLQANFEPIWFAKHYTQLLAEGLITEEQAKKYEERVKL